MHFIHIVLEIIVVCRFTCKEMKFAHIYVIRCQVVKRKDGRTLYLTAQKLDG